MTPADVSGLPRELEEVRRIALGEVAADEAQVRGALAQAWSWLTPLTSALQPLAGERETLPGVVARLILERHTAQQQVEQLGQEVQRLNTLEAARSAPAPSCEHHRGAAFGCDVCVRRVRERLHEFPLQLTRNTKTKPGPTSIPWPVAEKAWATYSQLYGRGQSVERLAERGGFGWAEMDSFFPGWREATDAWRKLAQENAALHARLEELEEAEGMLRAADEKVKRAVDSEAKAWATLREQKATLRAERDALRAQVEAARPVAEYAAYHCVSQKHLPEDHMVLGCGFAVVQRHQLRALALAFGTLLPGSITLSTSPAESTTPVSMSDLPPSFAGVPATPAHRMLSPLDVRPTVPPLKERINAALATVGCELPPVGQEVAEAGAALATLERTVVGLAHRATQGDELCEQVGQALARVWPALNVATPDEGAAVSVIRAVYPGLPVSAPTDAARRAAEDMRELAAGAMTKHDPPCYERPQMGTRPDMVGSGCGNCDRAQTIRALPLPGEEVPRG